MGASLRPPLQPCPNPNGGLRYDITNYDIAKLVKNKKRTKFFGTKLRFWGSNVWWVTQY